MNANRITTLALATLVLAAPAALAQTPQEQTNQALQHATETTQDAANDPQSMMMNATNASWQGNQANWTKTWTCATAYALDENAGDAAQQATGCPTPQNAQAGQDDENQRNQTPPRADADELEDADTAAQDLQAAALAYAEDLQEDPQNADEHTFTLLNRTLAILERLLDPPRIALSLAHDATTTAATSTISAIKAQAQSLQNNVEHLANATKNTAIDAGHSTLSAITHTAETATQALKNLIPNTNPPTHHPASDELDPATEPSETVNDLTKTAHRIA